MAVYSIPDILEWASAAQPLAFQGEIEKQYTKGSTVDLDLYQKIYIERKILQWQYEQDPTDSDGILYRQGNYVYALLFPYLFDAQQATGGGGQVVNPTTPAGSLPQVYDFEVEATATSNAPIANGDASLLINGENGVYDYRGYNVTFFRNNIPQSVVNQGGSYYSWNRTSGLFTCYPAATTGELFTITPIG